MATPNKIREEYHNSLDRWAAQKDIPLAAQSLVKKIASEAMLACDSGDWTLGLLLSQYTHDVAKLFNYNGWYSFFLDVRKVRDLIDSLRRKDR